MTARIIAFPARRFAAVRVVRYEGAWLVVVGEHGWAHGDRAAAIHDAKWLSENLALPIREVA